jgi:hypothetical protein
MCNQGEGLFGVDGIEGAQWLIAFMMFMDAVLR